MVFMRLGPDFSHFGHKFLLENIFLGGQETEHLAKSFSESCYFHFFSLACFFGIISSMSHTFLAKYF